MTSNHIHNENPQSYKTTLRYLLLLSFSLYIQERIYPPSLPSVNPRCNAVLIAKVRCAVYPRIKRSKVTEHM